EAAGAARLYVTVPGRRVWAADPGTRVAKGDVVVVLENLDLKREFARWEGELRRQQARLEGLQTIQADSTSLAAEILVLRESVADLNDRLARLGREMDELTLRAPQSGVVLPAPRRQPVDDPHSLPTWSGTALDPENQGALLERGTLVCLVGEPGAMEAHLAIPRGDVERVAIGQEAAVRLDERPAWPLTGRVAGRARGEHQRDRRRPATEPSARRAGGTGPQWARLSVCRAVVQLDGCRAPRLLGAAGRPKIRVAPRPLGQRHYELV